MNHEQLKLHGTKMVEYYKMCSPFLASDIEVYVEESQKTIIQMKQDYETLLNNFNALEKSGIKFVKKIKALERELECKRSSGFT